MIGAADRDGLEVRYCNGGLYDPDTMIVVPLLAASRVVAGGLVELARRNESACLTLSGRMTTLRQQRSSASTYMEVTSEPQKGMTEPDP